MDIGRKLKIHTFHGLPQQNIHLQVKKKVILHSFRS
jgi:hypothetical protein